MRRSPVLTAATVTGLLAALALAGPASGNSSGVPSGAQRPLSALPTGADSSRVLLPTGDTVRLATRSGSTTAAVAAAAPGSATAQFEQLTGGGHRYVLPVETRPFVGRVLDPSLFDVATLVGTERPDGIPVTLSVRRGAHIDVPGLVITSRTATTVTGRLAPSGAAAFRAALLTAAIHDPDATALFGGVRRLAVTGAPTGDAPAAQPGYPQVTLVLDVLDAKGKPASDGLIGLINTDDGRRYVNFISYFHGEARASVPLGHYSAITDVTTFHEHGTQFSVTDRIMPIADFTVRTDLQTVTFDARTATAQPSVRTPKPATAQSKSVEFDRFPVGEGSLGSSWSFNGPDTVLVTPTPPAKVGTIDWLSGWSLTGDAGASPYSYDLSFLSAGSVPADQAETVQPFQLGRIDAHYYNSTPADSQFVRIPLYPFQFGAFGEFLPLHTPTVRTEYVYADPSAVWQDNLILSPSDEDPFGGTWFDDFRSYPAGSQQRIDWGRGPLAPAPPEVTPADSYYYCPACRTADRLSVELAPVADTTPGHQGSVEDPPDGTPATQFTLLRDGHKVASGPDLIGASVHVPAGAANYELKLAVNRAADYPLTSTSTTTDLTFRSSADSGGALPHGWFCPVKGTGCTVLPVLRALVPLPTDLTDRMPLGANTFTLTVAPYRGAGSDTITSADVETSVDGHAFTPAALTRIGNGRYRVTITNPDSSAGQAVTLRVSATDDQGGSLVQTTRAAYLVADS